jgi:multicomponent Na+:H+ antiporter subunit E
MNTVRPALGSRYRSAMAFALRYAIFAVLWWVLAEGDLRAPLLAAVIVLGATVSSMLLQRPSGRRWSPLAALKLAGYFLLQSVLGGVDVARRALAPAMPVRPALIEYELTLSPGFATVLYAWLVSLTPGSASVHLESGTLTIHVLDERLPVKRTLRALEQRVAAVFYSGSSASPG